MRKFKSCLLILLLLVMIIPIQSNAFSLAPTSNLAGVNDWVSVTSPNNKFDWIGYGDVWKDTYNPSYAPYIRVYHYNVTKGEDYTLYMKMPMDQGYMNMYVTGVNPTSNTYNTPDKTLMGFVMHFQQPWVQRPENIDVYRKTLRISPESQSESLYIICTFENPSSSFEFMLKTPKDSDDDVVDSTINPYVPSRNGYTWGGVMGTPIFLEAGTAPGSASGTTLGSDSPYSDDHSNLTHDETTHTPSGTSVDTSSAKDVKVLNLNTEYAYLSSHQVETLKLKEIYRDDWAMTYQVYGFKLEANQKYTFDFMVKSYNNVNAFLIGENPFGSGPMNMSTGSNTVIAAFQDQPISSLNPDEWHASRTQFMTASGSTGNTLYVLVRGGYEDEQFKFKLVKGYLSSEEETYNPYADTRLGYKWVNLWQTPLRLWK